MRAHRVMEEEEATSRSMPPREAWGEIPGRPGHFFGWHDEQGAATSP